MSGRVAVLAGGFLLCASALGAQAQGSGPYVPAPRGGRASYDLDRGWLFLRQSAREPSALAALAAGAWSPVDLPRGEAGWYRRDITVGDTAGVRYLLHFLAAGGATGVFVNGVRAGGHEGGGIGFEVPLTPLLRPGQPNRLELRVDEDARAGPADEQACGATAGITGDVSLDVLPATRLTGLRIETPDVTGFSGRAQLEVDMVQAGEPADYAVEAAILAPGGDVVARRTQAAPTPGGTRTVTIELPEVKAPKLWSPASPALYSARVRLLANGKRVDEMSDRFGFRWFQFRGGAFYLNGQPLPVRGATWREDTIPPGAAADPARRQALASIRAAGNTVLRLAQHPYAPGLYRAADELGLLLWDGLPWCGGGPGDPVRQAGTRRLLEEQVRQNFNHPSIIAWSLGAGAREGPELAGGDAPARLHAFIRALSDLAHALDPGRLTGFRGYAGAAGLVDVVEEALAPGWRGESSEAAPAGGGRAGAGAPAPLPGAGRGAPVTRMDTLALGALDSAGARYLRAAQRLDPAQGFPRSARAGGSWTTTEVSEWTSGFFAGTLWSLYELTGSQALRAQAERWTAPLPAIFHTEVSHDLGFQFFTTDAKAFRLTGEERYRATALEAAWLLAGRFNARVGATRSWNGMGPTRPFPVIADNVMNLELLFWGARQGGSAEWADMARRHAATTLTNHVRADGGSFHVVSFDTVTGRALERFTVQGYADSSTWARGEAWLLYGFTMASRETPESAQLASGPRRIADYFLAHLPPDGIPCWDFQAPGCPGEPALRDASAAAIAASGLLELSTRVPGSTGAGYRAAAERTLATLLSRSYLAPGGSDALLLHVTGNRPGNSEVDVSIVYADYYFVEALMRYLELRGLRPRTLLPLGR